MRRDSSNLEEALRVSAVLAQGAPQTGNVDLGPSHGTPIVVSHDSPHEGSCGGEIEPKVCGPRCDFFLLIVRESVSADANLEFTFIEPVKRESSCEVRSCFRILRIKNPQVQSSVNLGALDGGSVAPEDDPRGRVLGTEAHAERLGAMMIPMDTPFRREPSRTDSDGIRSWRRAIELVLAPSELLAGSAIPLRIIFVFQGEAVTPHLHDGFFDGRVVGSDDVDRQWAVLG